MITDKPEYGVVIAVLDSLISLYGQLGGLGTGITLLILLLFAGAAYANTLVRRKYISLSEELAGFCAGAYTSFNSEILQWMTEEYKEAANNGTAAVNTPAIIETGLQAYLKPCMLAERFLKKANSLMVTAGLFGTFVGLTYAVGNIGNIMANTNADSLMRDTGADTMSLLITSFKGMAVAFVTSLFGTGLSILHMIILTLFSATGAKNLLTSQLEEYLDVKIAAEINEIRLLKEKQTEDDKNAKTTDLMVESIQIFQKATADFTESLNGLKDFNDIFSTNIDRVRDSAVFLGNALDKTSETVYESSVKIYNCTGIMQSITNEITLGNKRLENTTSVLSELKLLIGDSKKDRDLFLKSIYEIPDKLLNYHEAAVASVDVRQVKP